MTIQIKHLNLEHGNLTSAGISVIIEAAIVWIGAPIEAHGDACGPINKLQSVRLAKSAELQIILDNLVTFIDMVRTKRCGQKLE